MNFLKLKLSLLVCFFLGAMPSYGQQSKAIELTQRVLHYLSTQQFDSICTLHDSEMKRQLDADNYEVMWSNFIDNYDTLQTIDETKVTNIGDTSWLTETKISFVKKSFLFKLTINKSNQVAGIFFANTKVNYAPPAYINTLNFYEVKLPVPTKGIVSEGMLSIPRGAGPFPLVIILGGSGPTDKDASMGPNKPYKDLAWAIAAKGIAVYRFDKRTANAGNVKGAKHFTMHQEYVLDLQNIINKLAKDARINKKQIYIMGHSQGGYMLPYFAKTCKGIKGFIGLAANYQTIVEIIPAQLNYLGALQKDSASQVAIKNLVARANYTQANLYDKTVVKDSLFPGITIDFARHMDINKPANIAQVLMKKPVLFIQGKRDYQVPPTELESWKTKLNGACCIKYVLFDKLNHLMVEGEGASTPTEYNLPNHVPEYVADEVVNWILETNKK
jgi:alpha-beta hydrolase superfamily lysophospholipase